MSVFKQLSLLLTLAISVISCNDVSKHHDFESKYSFEKVDSLIINLDNKTSYEFRNLHYYQNDSLEWLAVMNENINGLNIYDLNSDLVSQFSVPKSGPHSVPTLNGFTIISPDSIFLYTRMSIKNIEIVNYRGDTLSNLRVSNPKEVSDYKHPVFNHVSNNPGPTIFYNNKTSCTLPNGLYLVLGLPKIYLKITRLSLCWIKHLENSCLARALP